MNVRAGAVILTDTKSLSRFSIMKFSSVNVQSGSFFCPLVPSFKGSYPEAPGSGGLAARSRTHVCERRTYGGVRTATANHIWGHKDSQTAGPMGSFVLLQGGKLAPP